MVRLDDFMEENNESIGTLYANIYPVLEYPEEIKVIKEDYVPEEPYTPSPWKLRDGNFIYFFGKGLGESSGSSDKLTYGKPIFGKIIKRYLLASLSENIKELWRIEYFGSNLIISKDVDEDYQHNDTFNLRYFLLLQTHHWQEKYFGLIVNLKIKIIEKENNSYISYEKIGQKYSWETKRSVWREVQRLHGTHFQNGGVRGDGLKKKFEIMRNLFKDAFGVKRDILVVSTEDGEFKMKINPLEVVEVESE